MTNTSTQPGSPGSPDHFFRLRQGTAAKLSPHAQGSVSYDVLTDAAHLEVFISITDSASSAYFSRQPIPISKIETTVTTAPADKPLTAGVLRQLYLNKSINNSGFLASALVGEDLLGRVPGKAHGLVNRENWESWKQACLADAGGDLTMVSFGSKASDRAPTVGDDGTASIETPSPESGEAGEPGEPGARLNGKSARRGKAKG